MCLLHDGTECFGLVDGQVGQNLPVHFDTSQGQTIDEAAVCQCFVVAAHSGVDPLDPQCAEVPLAVLTVARGVLVGFVDRLTGDLWIGDVGQNAWEEIDFQPASSAGGENYGWRCREGNHNYNTSGCSGPYTAPLYEYRQNSSSGNPWGYCVTGGFCYGGFDLLGIQGTYFFADYSRNWIWSFRRDASGVVAELQNRSTELDPPGSASIRSICSFGEDGRGELYVLDLSGGEVFKIVPNFMDLQVPTLVAGSGATITLAGATPNSPVYLAYSMTGLALTEIPQLGVNMVLRNPRLAATRNSSGAGAASFNVNVPAGAFGRNVWIQAAEIDNVIPNCPTTIPKAIRRALRYRS